MRPEFKDGRVVYLHGHQRPMVLAIEARRGGRWLCQWQGDNGQPFEAWYDVNALSLSPAE